MMRPVGEVQVYLHRAPIDMRRGRNGLAALAQEVMKLDPFCGALFIYVGRRYDALKIFYWEKNGWAVWHKKNWPGRWQGTLDKVWSRNTGPTRC